MVLGFVALMIGLLGAVFGLVVAVAALLFVVAICLSPLLLLLVLIRPRWLTAGGNARRVPILLVGLVLVAGFVLMLQFAHHMHFSIYHWPGIHAPATTIAT